MSETCPTVRVVSEASPEGFVSINVADYDPAVHQLLEGEEDTVEAALLEQFAGVSRAALIEMAVAEFRLDIADVSDDELRHGLIGHRRNRAARAKAEAQLAEVVETAVEVITRDQLDRDGDGKRGGDLPDGFMLGNDGSVTEVLTGKTWPSAEAFREWRAQRNDLVAELSALGVEWEGDLDNDALAALRDEERAKREFLLGSSVLPSIVEVGALKVQLGGLVVASQRESGLSVADWNAEDEPAREARLQATLDRLSADPEAAAAEIDASAVLPAPEVGETVETKADPVEIPADWNELHWTQRVKLAKELSTPEAAAGITSKDEADKVIADEAARRAAAEASA